MLGWRVGVHLTGEVDIVSFTDVVELEGISYSDGDPGSIYYSGETTKLIRTNTESGCLPLPRLDSGKRNVSSTLLTFDIKSDGVLHISSEVGNLRPAGQVGLVQFPGGGDEDGADQRVALSLGLERVLQVG